MRHLGTARRILLGSAIMGLAACSGTGQDLHAQYPQPAQAQPGGILAIANDMAAKGDHSAAAPLYRQQASATGNPEAIVGLARSLSALGKYDEAENILQDLALRGSMGQEAWYLLGKSRIALGKFDTALIALDQAAALSPMDTRVNSARGISLAALGRVGDAIAAFQNSVDAASLGNLALVFAMTGNAEAAVNILEPLAASGQATAQGRQNLAMAYLLAGRENEARQMARLDLDPISVDETFTFYRTLASLPVDKRMQALTTGVIAPDWTLEESGNLMLAESDTRDAAAMRIAAKPVLATVDPAPEPVVEAEPVHVAAVPEPVKVDVANYELKELPPLVEPHGWALQIGAYRTEKALMRGWTILYRANADLLGDIPPRRSEVDFGNREGKPKGFYYRLNAGPLKSLGQARELCRELLTRGTECWVRPPEKSEGRVTAPAKESDTARDVSTASREDTTATNR